MLLYIHIPFCFAKCAYCGFNSFVGALGAKDAYLDALNVDLSLSLRDISMLDSVFIGGGTPNTLEPRDFARIFDILAPHINSHTEITMECNPNARGAEFLGDFVNLGINRFSIGVQSFYDDKLRLLGRTHNAISAQKFIEHATKIAQNVSIDLIYDVVLDSRARLKNELKIADSLGIGHISCYALSIDENSEFFAKSINPTRKNSLCYELKEILENLGFVQYEVSNYVKTHKSAHNLGYWSYREYTGVGLGAVGRIGAKRFYKNNDLASYIKNPHATKIENLSAQNIRTEKIFLGLRSEAGVDAGLIDKERLKILLDENALFAKGERIFARNYFIADEIALRLI